ncbi:MAG TPA: hypothetical protein PLO25_02190 [Candidatus Saccharibacteria bacterium]|nr:hypothetical protein [Candidatus Saccharibacteria bacterium]
MRYLPNNGYIFLRNLIYITIFSILFATISSSNLLAKDYYASGAVSITIPKTTEEVSFGPVKVVLQDVTKASEPSNIATVEANKVTLNPSGGTISATGGDANAEYTMGDNFIIPLDYYFEKPKLNDNNKYRFCIADTTYCSISTSPNEYGFVNADIIFGKLGYEVEDLSSLTTSTGETAIPSSGDVNGGSTGKPTTCAIDGIGWIVCPVVKFLANIADWAYNYLSDNFLVIQAGIFDTGIENGTYSTWQSMRNIANVLFVIAFLVIIFSQMTGVGITNYGVKKMLPRLIIVAILVNISYFICQIAVDLSNILGYSIKDFLSQIITLSQPAQSQTTTWVGIVGGVLGATAGISILFSSLAALMPVIIAGVISLMMILLILIVRQVLVILLVVFSPLAFIAYLLPNTESFFKKWQKIFISMLLVFPIIGLVYGGSTLASNIIRNSASSTFTIEGENGATNTQADNGNLMKIAAAGMAVLPLLLVPSILKKSLDGVGNVGATINGIGNHVGGALGKSAGDATGAAVERGWNRFDNAAMNGRAGMFGRARAGILRRRSRTSSVDEFQKSELKRAQSEYIANLAGTDREFRGRMSAGGAAGADMRAIAGATNTIAELDSKEVAAAATVIGKMNLNSKEKIALARGEDVTKNGYTLSGKDSAVRRAGIRSALATATVDEAEQIVRSSGNMSSSERREITSSLISTGLVNKATHLSGETLGKIEQGELGVSEAEIEKSLNDAVISNINKGKYSAEKLTANDAESLKRIENIMNDPSAIAAIGVDKYAGMIQEAVKAWTDPRLSGTTTKAQKEIINRLRFPGP